MKRQMRHFLSVFLFACTLSFVAGPAFAEVVTFNFTGTVTFVAGSPFGLSPALDASVTGSIVYDTSLAPDLYTTGSYTGSVMVIVIGGATVQSEGYASLQVVNDGASGDSFSGFFNAISVNYESGSIGFNLGDTSGTVFSSTALPDSLDVDSFNTRTGFIFTGTGTAFFSIDTLEKALIPVKIDIKPGSFPNSINPKSKGKIPVAILTTDSSDNGTTFDATTVDPTSVLFGPTGMEAFPANDALEDVDADGDVDMILHFYTQETGINCEDPSATLTGETFDGQAIKGDDTIRTVGCK